MTISEMAFRVREEADDYAEDVVRSGGADFGYSGMMETAAELWRLADTLDMWAALYERRAE